MQHTCKYIKCTFYLLIIVNMCVHYVCNLWLFYSAVNIIIIIILLLLLLLLLLFIIYCNFPVCNVKHVLSCCSVALSDGRYTWRHNLVLEELVKFLKAFNPSGSVFADLPGHRACESPAATIPPKIIATSARPDIFIIYDNQAVIIELTVPWNSQSNIQKARSFKQNKDNYQHLVSDLSMLGYSVQLQTIEIGCLGHYTSEAYAALKSGAPNSKPADRRCALTHAAKTAISSSYFLFTSRSLPDKLEHQRC